MFLFLFFEGASDKTSIIGDLAVWQIVSAPHTFIEYCFQAVFQWELWALDSGRTRRSTRCWGRPPSPPPCRCPLQALSWDWQVCLYPPLHRTQGCGSAFIWSGSGSSILGWIPIRIQGFDDQKLKKIYGGKKVLKKFGSKTIGNLPIPRPPQRTSQLQK